MEIVKTIAPISIEELKKYFVDNTIQYLIDYKNSTLKGSKLLIYLGNLNIPCNLETEIDDDFLELLKDYFHSKTIVNIPLLEVAAVEVLLVSKGLYGDSYSGLLSYDQINTFKEKNEEILSKWYSVLESLALYNMQIVEVDEFKDFAKSHPENDTEDLTGINFVSILKYPSFYMFFGKVEEKNLFYYSKYFNEYMFKGKNLYNYWATENNPMFLLTIGLASGDLTSEEVHKAYEIAE
jgi:hypothetical protein